uniref:F-box domain-containing protein n=2 Tax=Meloidogyne TaxID=189290 RepID=A0A6V7TZ34_MELEN|nr:unnamed protein product [Meloidogyne enterolobii]
MFYSLPTETTLDIFKFLNYRKLCSIKITNLYFRDFINNFEGELAREAVIGISIDYFDKFKELPHKLIRTEAGDFDFAIFDEQSEEVNKQHNEKWDNRHRNPIPLYLFEKESNCKNIVICLFIGYIYKTSYIILELPTIISNRNHIKIVYYYLNRLFKCSINTVYFNQFLLNPELIQLLFVNAKIPKQLNAKKSWLTPSKACKSENFLKFVLNYLISKYVEITFPSVNNIEEYFDILFKILMNGGEKFKEVNFRSRQMSQLLDLFINHTEMPKDCSKMVAKIQFNNLLTNPSFLLKLKGLEMNV